MTEKTLHEHLAEIAGIVGYIQKDATNDFQRYKYASAEKVFTKVRDELSARGIIIERDVELSGVKFAEPLTKIDDNGHAQPAGINVIYDYVGYFVLGNKQVAFCGSGQGFDKGDKGVMKAETAALKYALAGTFLISWGDDPEADISTDKDARSPAPKKRRATKKKPAAIAEFRARLEACETSVDLNTVATDIRSSKLTMEDKQDLTKIYFTKKEQLDE